jgi:cyclopropane fatty-acyl-phospholipid synthase-like methyltransferase
MGTKATIVESRTQIWRDAAEKEMVEGVNSYKGLQAHSRAGLHAHVAGLFRKHVPITASVLEMAAGSGAFALRLTDLGYNVRATDYVETNFRIADQIPFKAADLNSAFAAELGPVDAVTAMEIIEHLENPHHFLREIRKMLPPGGTLVLSSPNPNSPVSKAQYLRTNYFTWFTEEDWDTQCHIAPLNVMYVRPIAKESGFEVLDLHTFGDSFEHVAKSPRQRMLSRAVDLLDSSPKHLRGDIWIAVLRAV